MTQTAFDTEKVRFCVFLVLSTNSVLKHILEERLKVQVAWLGDNLDSVIAHFTAAKVPFLLLHYTPSTLILKYQLRSVMFPACKDPLLRRDGSDAHCVYAPNRLAKVVWSPVQNEAPSLYRSPSEYPEFHIFNFPLSIIHQVHPTFRIFLLRVRPTADHLQHPPGVRWFPSGLPWCGLLLAANTHGWRELEHLRR